MEASEILAKARAREAARAAAERPRADYAAANKMFRSQKAALTRAINSGDRDKVLVACEKAVREWNADFPFAGMWPDDWSRWQRALDDVFPVFQAPELTDLT
jgi:hypothetical protein